MRDQNFYNTLGGRNILQVALDVHATATGAYERPAAEQADDVGLLSQVVMEWSDTQHQQWRRFDEAVQALLKAALAEAGV